MTAFTFKEEDVRIPFKHPLAIENKVDVQGIGIIVLSLHRASVVPRTILNTDRIVLLFYATVSVVIVITFIKRCWPTDWRLNTACMYFALTFEARATRSRLTGPMVTLRRPKSQTFLWSSITLCTNASLSSGLLWHTLRRPGGIYLGFTPAD